MIELSSLLAVAGVSLLMVLTPGPNMVHLASKTLSQGRSAGLISLAGIGSGFLCYLLAATLGLSTLFASVPVTYDIVRIAGAAYLGYLAWTLLRPGGKAIFSPSESPYQSGKNLFFTGWGISLLNPKIALMYSALLPQFISAEQGQVFGQFLQLGVVQILVSIVINGLIVFFAAAVSGFFQNRPAAMQLQRWVSGSVIGLLAADILFKKRLV